MNAIKLFILWLSASNCLAKIIKESSKTEELTNLAESAVEILSRCYKTRVNTVGVAGNLVNFRFDTLCSQESFAVTLIGNNTDDEPIDRRSRHKLQLFIVTASTSNQLNNTLRQIKSSLWWNHMATFFIIDWQSTIIKNTCSNAFEFMWTAWEMNLLEATYLCLHRTRGTLIYTYNPYTSEAPEPWNLVKIYNGKNDHPWTMYMREYDVVEVCENLEFDKTNDLAGYEISATVKEFPPTLFLDYNKTGINSITGLSGILVNSIFHALNATSRLIVHNMKRPGLFDTKGNDIAMDTVNGISDIVLLARFHMGVLNYTVSYPFYETGFNIVTQYSGQQSQLHKLITVLDSKSRFGVCLVILTILIFFKFFRRQTLGSAILNTFRIISNSGLTKVPENQGARIFLTGIFILVVTIVGIYQGMLASLLTKSKPLSNVETLDDLAEREYTIHSNKLYARIFMTPLFKFRFIGHDDHLCLGSVVIDTSAACVASRVLVFEKAVQLKLHISRELTLKTNLVYVIRDDWPLEERLNKILGAFAEADISAQILNAVWKKSDRIAKFNELMEKEQKCKVMTLNDLTFAFIFLGIGLVFATASFIVEVSILSLISRIKNIGNGIRSRLDLNSFNSYLNKISPVQNPPELNPLQIKSPSNNIPLEESLRTQRTIYQE